MSDPEIKDSGDDSFDSFDSPIHTPIEFETTNSKKRNKKPSTSSESPSPVQKPKSNKFRKTSHETYSDMDEATKNFFKDLILQSEERTQSVVKSEVASVKSDFVKAINNLEGKILSLKLELDAVNASLRKKNIIIQGLKEKKDETWKDLGTAITDFYTQLGITEKPDYDDCYRIGKPVAGKERPVMLKLLRQRDKKLIMSHRKNLKGTLIFVNDDQPKDVRKKLSVLRSKERDLRKQYPGARIFIRNQTLILKDRSISKQYIVNASDQIAEKLWTTRDSTMEY
jgi:hypothetical protein